MTVAWRRLVWWCNGWSIIWIIVAWMVDDFQLVIHNTAMMTCYCRCWEQAMTWAVSHWNQVITANCSLMINSKETPILVIRVKKKYAHRLWAHQPHWRMTLEFITLWPIVYCHYCILCPQSAHGMVNCPRLAGYRSALADHPINLIWWLVHQCQYW